MLRNTDGCRYLASTDLFKLYWGPIACEQVADSCRSAGITVHSVGTEHIYVRMTEELARRVLARGSKDNLTWAGETLARAAARQCAELRGWSTESKRS